MAASMKLAFFALVQYAVVANCQVLLFPTQYRLIHITSTTATTASLTACHQLVSTKIAKGFFGWDSSSKICTYGETINGFIYGNDTVTPGALVSATSAEVTEVSWLEAETYIMNQVYASGECPTTTTLSGQFCVTQIPNKRWGVYLAGHYKNNTILLLTKTQVKASLTYYCDTIFSVRMIFGGVWYCYTRFDNIGTLNYNTIATNKCASLQAGSSVIKLTDKDRECGFLNENKNGFDVFLSLILPTGVKKTATAFKYHDGTLPGTLPWGVGYPNVTDATKNLVICDAVQWGYIRDVTATSFKSLFCKKPAIRATTTTSTTTTTTTTTTTSTTTTTEEPTTTTEEPTTTTEEPTTTTEEPTTTTEEPTTTTEEPATTSEEPDTTTEEPITATEEPITGTEEPITATEEPVTATEEPVTGTEEPITATKEPITGTEEPITGTEEPITGTEAPITGTEEPITATEEPVTGTEAPITATEEPITGTEEPITGTEAPITGTEEPITTSTPIPCDPLEPTTHVGLIVDSSVNQQGGNNWPIVAECLSCTTNAIKLFWNSAEWANPVNAGANGQKIGVQCASACVCDESGECYTPGASAPTTLSFYPYCANGGDCHMYVVQEGPEDASMVGPTKTVYLADKYVNNVDETLKDMDPDATPQPYILAASVSCDGCGNIENELCTGPPTPITCDALSPTTQVGIIVDSGTTEQGGQNWPVVASCTSCTAGIKRFYNTGAYTNPVDASANGEKAIGVQCANMCVCDKSGECYTPGASAPMTLSFYPYCNGGVCHMYVVQEGPEDASMVGPTKTVYLADKYANDVDETLKDMDPNATPQPYILAVSMSCGGCANIKKDVCTGPSTPA